MNRFSRLLLFLSLFFGIGVVCGPSLTDSSQTTNPPPCCKDPRPRASPSPLNHGRQSNINSSTTSIVYTALIMNLREQSVVVDTQFRYVLYKFNRKTLLTDSHDISLSISTDLNTMSSPCFVPVVTWMNYVKNSGSYDGSFLYCLYWES